MRAKTRNRLERWGARLLLSALLWSGLAFFLLAAREAPKTPTEVQETESPGGVEGAAPLPALSLESTPARRALPAPAKGLSPSGSHGAAKLLPVIERSALEVASEPSGCAVYLDGVYLGQSPLEARGVRRGSHTLRLRRFPFAEKRLDFVLEEERLRLSATLEPRMGQISLRGAPGVEVLVDGQAVGRLPLAPIPLAVGPHRVEAGAWSRTLEVEESQRLTYEVGRPAPPARATPEPRSSLLVSSEPWAEVYLDGARQGFTPLLLEGMAEGTHKLELLREGYRTEARLVRLSPGQNATVRLELARD